MGRPQRRGYAQRHGDSVSSEVIAGCVRDFLEWMDVHAYSQTSQRTMHYQLSSFRRWCTDRNVERPQDVTLPLLEQYQTWLFHRRKKDGQPLSATSQHIALVAVRQLFRWLMRKGVLLMNPAAEIQLPRLPHRLPTEVLTAAEVELVMAAVDLRSNQGVRDRTILEVLYSTGMRRHELSRLDVHQVDHARGVVVIELGKGGKDRVVPIGTRALEWVTRYAQEARPEWLSKKNVDETALFIGKDGFRFMSNSVTRMVHHYVLKADIGKTGSAHMLRHTMATLMLEGGADIRFIQQILGHAALVSTQVYTHVSILKLKEVHSTTHPAAKPGHVKTALDDETRGILAKALSSDEEEADTDEIAED